jgi:outer membrane protein assembly factor BamB
MGLVLLSARDGSVRGSVVVGSDPVAVIVSDDGGTAYVADSAPGDVYALGLPDLTVRWKSHVGGAPFGMVLHRERLYVTLYDSASIAALDPSDGKVLATDPAPAHPAAITVDAGGQLEVAAGSAFGIALVGSTVWTADYRRSLLMHAAGGADVPLPLPVHPFWLAPSSGETLLIAAEGESEDTDPGAVFSYDEVSGGFTTLARPRDPDLALESGGTVFVAAHGDHEVLAIRGGVTDHWAVGASPVALAADPNLGLLAVAVNSHE